MGLGELLKQGREREKKRIRETETCVAEKKGTQLVDLGKCMARGE